MNITQALNVALPDMPAKLISQHFPRVHPEVAYKEQMEEGQLVVKAVVPGVDAMYTFPAENWKLIELFDGQRSYQEIAETYTEMTGVEYTEEIIRDFASDMDAMNFWFKTAQEKNVKLMMKSAEERRKMLQKKSNWGDMSLIKFPAVNPDRYLAWLYQRIKFVYTPWFTIVTLIAFSFTTWIFVTHWSEIGYDTLRFYNFTEKSWWDVAMFWFVGAGLLCIHETAHGLTCKHYGARVPAMGFLLIYLTPAFYTDTTEGEMMGNRFQRLMITVAGVWSELILCAIVTPIWWGTATGTPVHDLAYLIILFTGIAVMFVNWNPLMKLDGYYILCELLGISDLKEASTLYLSGWVKRHIWRLPVEVPYVPKRRRLGFVIYAVLSGLYSYSVLYVFASFIGNIFRNFNPDWAFIPEYGTAYLIFSGRIQTLINFMKFVYLDKKDRVAAWFTPQRKFISGAAAALFLLLPLWHETAAGRFILEPGSRAVVRTLSPGMVTAVFADEGQRVAAGAELVRMRNLQIDSRLAGSQADYSVATSRANSARMRYAGFGSADQDRMRLARQTANLGELADSMRLESPLTGVVLTPRLNDRLGAYVPAGTELVEVGDLSTLRAQIYISEHDLNRFQDSSSAHLHVDGRFGTMEASSVKIAPMSTRIVPGLMDLSKFAGMRAPNFYVVELLVENADGKLAPGMIGTARLYGHRRSLFMMGWSAVADFVGRKIW